VSSSSSLGGGKRRGLRRTSSEGNGVAAEELVAGDMIWGATAHADADAQAEADAEDEVPQVVAAAEAATVMLWTSDETRRREYEAIDRRSKGLRGLWNRLIPRFARSATKSRFYDEKDGSDAGSVRRHRLVLDGDHS
jgi:hypothetical protein